jgi:uncharacterized FAD-dependent dehydrogenase
MIKEISISLPAKEALSEQSVKQFVTQELGLGSSSLFTVQVVKRSIDARNRNIKMNLKLRVVIGESLTEEKIEIDYKQVNTKQIVYIVGAGPAGLFAALKCIELGIKPIIIERGKKVRDRRRDLATINKAHIVNPESNYCFGEGGAGTYSDGKLYTRSGKRGSIDKVLKTLIYHGAHTDIIVDAHPHIGTNKLPGIIENIRNTILQYGGEIWFETKLVDVLHKNNAITSITVQSENEGSRELETTNLILASGHSARDIYTLLHDKKIYVEAKPFAMGVRVEHPQEIIDSIQYHCASKNEWNEKREFLPSASYSLVHQVNGRGVYSFCMCPGGIIAPCATYQEEVVTNGWSPSKRNNPFANSGIVVELKLSDFKSNGKHDPFSALRFQKELERNAWIYGGKTQTAPAQRLLDFINNRESKNLPDCSYQPGIVSVGMDKVLGPLIANSLRGGFKGFGQKMRNYLSNDAIIVGVESRTSTPVRIPRDSETLEHIEIKGLYPCGEGAGYAGGIVSAAIDGERCAEMACDKF